VIVLLLSGKTSWFDTKAAGDNHWHLLEADGAMMKLRSWEVERQARVFYVIIAAASD
jgi:hypothetical protein